MLQKYERTLYVFNEKINTIILYLFYTANQLSLFCHVTVQIYYRIGYKNNIFSVFVQLRLTRVKPTEKCKNFGLASNQNQ